MKEDILTNINVSTIDEKIDELIGLSIEEQYNILCQAAKESDKDSMTILLFGNNGGFHTKRGIGIIDILNYKFPEGIEKISDLQKYIPYQLYENLIAYQPNDYENEKSGWVQLLEKTNIFKNENGEVDKSKIVEYLSYSRVKNDFDSDLFTYLDPDDDKKRNNANYSRKNSSSDRYD